MIADRSCGRPAPQFRSLALRILENSLRDQADDHQAQKREVRRERSLDDAYALWTVSSQGRGRGPRGLFRILEPPRLRP